MARNVARDGDYSPLTAFEIAFPKAFPHIQHVAKGKGRYKLRELGVLYRGPGDWLAKVKAFDSEHILPVIVMSSGTSYAGALHNADIAVQAGRWKPDQFPGTTWLRD